MEKAIEAVKEWLRLEDVGAFVVMEKYGVEPELFWEAYRSMK